MAQSMIIGLLAAGYDPAKISVTARSESSLKKLSLLGKINVTMDNLAAVKSAKIIFICVKPKDVLGLLAQIKPALTPQQIVISIAALIKLQTLQEALPAVTNLIRAMPNTPVQLKQGIYGLVASANIAPNIKNSITALLELTGKTIWLTTEAEFDNLTLISGCAPAYVFLFAAALEQAALNLGIASAQAKMLAAQTVLGAGALAAASQEPTLQLCQNVCSPGGITEQGVKYLRENSFMELLNNAVDKTHMHLIKHAN